MRAMIGVGAFGTRWNGSGRAPKIARVGVRPRRAKKARTMNPRAGSHEPGTVPNDSIDMGICQSGDVRFHTPLLLCFCFPRAGCAYRNTAGGRAAPREKQDEKTQTLVLNKNIRAVKVVLHTSSKNPSRT